MVDDGNIVVFGLLDSYIENTSSGQRIPMNARMACSSKRSNHFFVTQNTSRSDDDHRSIWTETVSESRARCVFPGIIASCRHSLPAVMAGTSTPHGHRGGSFVDGTGIPASVGRAPNGGALLGGTQTQHLSTFSSDSKSVLLRRSGCGWAHSRLLAGKLRGTCRSVWEVK